MLCAHRMFAHSHLVAIEAEQCCSPVGVYYWVAGIDGKRFRVQRHSIHVTSLLKGIVTQIFELDDRQRHGLCPVFHRSRLDDYNGRQCATPSKAMGTRWCTMKGDAAVYSIAHACLRRCNEIQVRVKSAQKTHNRQHTSQHTPHTLLRRHVLGSVLYTPFPQLAAQLCIHTQHTRWLHITVGIVCSWLHCWCCCQVGLYVGVWVGGMGKASAMEWWDRGVVACVNKSTHTQRHM